MKLKERLREVRWLKNSWAGSVIYAAFAVLALVFVCLIYGSFFRYTRLQKLAAWAIFALTAAGSAGLLCFLADEGLKQGKKTPLLARLPLEVAVLIHTVAMLLCFFAARSNLGGLLQGVFFRGFIYGALPYMGLAALILHFLKSMYIRVSMGSFWKNTVLYRIGHETAALLRGLALGRRGKIYSILLLVWLLLILLIMLRLRTNPYVWPGERGRIWLVFVMVAVMAVSLPLFVLRAYRGFERLYRGAQALAEGNDAYQVDTKGMIGAMKEHGEHLNAIGEGVSKAVEARMKSEHMKTELITNVSHDIKTPLTSIINYTDLISKEETDNPKIREYAEILDKQSQKLKRLIENLIEASKASTGNIKMELQPCSLNVLLEQMTAEYEPRLQEKQLTLVMAPLEEELTVLADGRQLWRVFDNLMGNICKYAMERTRVYLDVQKEEQIKIIIKNISDHQLNMTEEELMERFTRGDSSRNTSGNGLGLSIAQSLMKLQKGSLHLVIDGDLFKAVVALEKAVRPEETVV